MRIIFRSILFFSFGFYLSIQSIPRIPSDNHNSHLAKYEKVNTTHHDNIADEELHTHSHKHSEDGEEHEHHHEHFKVNSLDFKVVFSKDHFFTKSSFIYVVNGQNEKSLHSTAHTLPLFRPPIS